MASEESVKKLPIVTVPSSFAINSLNTKTSTYETKQMEPSELRKRESLEQLSTNALAPYKPDLIGFENPESVKTYCCCYCGDTYICKSNLEFHTNRKSVLIHFNCDSCETVQVFYNRCLLLAHVTAHSDVGEPSDIRKAIVSPLPRVLMDGIHNDFVKSMEIEDIDDDRMQEEITTPSKLLEVSLHEIGEQPSTNTLITKEVQDITAPTVEARKNIRCSECEETFDNADERKDHFINSNKLPLTVNICTKCTILCPTECSSKAHKRLHLQISPYVCPECGDNPDRYWENFQKHLRYQCLHYSRFVGYKCPMCTSLSHSSDALKKHILAKHTVGLLKCHLCPMAYKTSAAFAEHKKKLHLSSDISCMLIFRCYVCNGAFSGKEGIIEHIGTHLKNNSQYVFKCPECSLPFLAKEILHEHMQKQHLKIYSEHVVGNVMGEADLNEENNLLEFNYSKIECLLCHCAFSSHQGYSLHVSRSHSYLKYPCGICGVPLRLRAERIMHGKSHLRNNVPLCLLCHGKPISAPESLDAHLLYHVERIKYRTICIVCGKGLFNFKEALQHLRSEHYLRSTALVNSPGNDAKFQEVNGNVQKQHTEIKVSNEPTNSNYVSPPKVLPTTSKFVHSIKDENDNGNQPKKLKSELGHCYKCNFSSSDRTEFKSHILTHKPTHGCYQCMECGQSYITEPTLKLHLKIHHHIADTDKYLEAEGTHHIPEKESSQEATKTNALECTVCFETFASEALLKTHTRSHGMAFIQTRKISVA